MPGGRAVWYETAHFCVSCLALLSEHERRYSSGRCPACGSKHENAASMVEALERPVRCERVLLKESGWWWWPFKVTTERVVRTIEDDPRGDRD